MVIVENNLFKYERFFMKSVPKRITTDWIFNEHSVASNDERTIQKSETPNSSGERYAVKKGKSKKAPPLGSKSPSMNKGVSLTVCLILANYLLIQSIIDNFFIYWEVII